MAAEAPKMRFHGRPGTVPQALCRAQNVSPLVKVIFALLTTYKEVFPGQQWLADHTPCSIPTVILRLRELELLGWIKREQRNRRMKETDLFHIYMECPAPLAERREWVQALGMTEKQIETLTKRDLVNTIKSIRFSKYALDKLLEPSEKSKSSEKEKLSEKDTSPNGDELCSELPFEHPQTRNEYAAAIIYVLTHNLADWYEYVAERHGKNKDWLRGVFACGVHGFNGEAPTSIEECEQLYQAVLATKKFPSPPKKQGSAVGYYRELIRRCKAGEMQALDGSWAKKKEAINDGLES